MTVPTPTLRLERSLLGGSVDQVVSLDEVGRELLLDLSPLARR